MEDVWEKPESNPLSPQSDKVPLQVRNRFPSNSPWGHRFLKLVSVSHYKNRDYNPSLSINPCWIAKNFFVS